MSQSGSRTTYYVAPIARLGPVNLWTDVLNRVHLVTYGTNWDK